MRYLTVINLANNYDYDVSRFRMYCRATNTHAISYSNRVQTIHDNQQPRFYGTTND
jgi:hypothetical protein